MSHFRIYGFEKWDSMISLMWDSTSVSQKCVVGPGLWGKSVIYRVLVLLCKIRMLLLQIGVIDDDNGVLTCNNCLFLEM